MGGGKLNGDSQMAQTSPLKYYTNNKPQINFMKVIPNSKFILFCPDGHTKQTKIITMTSHKTMCAINN